MRRRRRNKKKNGRKARHGDVTKSVKDVPPDQQRDVTGGQPRCRGGRVLLREAQGQLPSKKTKTNKNADNLFALVSRETKRNETDWQSKLSWGDVIALTPWDGVAWRRTTANYRTVAAHDYLMWGCATA